MNTTWGIGFTDVFEDCFYEKGNELLTDDGTMGYYTDNELHWRGSSGAWVEDIQGQTTQTTALIDDYINLPAKSSGKRRL